jgi:hypothetical protein|tara:strand:+ start:433 stop:768 length:336 start_codon:yes stop_codon:yes gene_type:complete
MGGTDATSMRSVAHDNNNDTKSIGLESMGHSLTGLVGGKRRRSKKSRKTKTKRSKSARSKRVKRGGMGFGFGAALKEAVVPFGIFALQKRSQRRRSGKKPFRKNRTNKRRR